MFQFSDTRSNPKFAGPELYNPDIWFYTKIGNRPDWGTVKPNYRISGTTLRLKFGLTVTGKLSYLISGRILKFENGRIVPDSLGTGYPVQL